MERPQRGRVPFQIFIGVNIFFLLCKKKKKKKKEKKEKDLCERI